MDFIQDRLKNNDDDMHQIKKALYKNLVREIQHIFIEFSCTLWSQHFTVLNLVWMISTTSMYKGGLLWSQK